MENSISSHEINTENFKVINLSEEDLTNLFRYYRFSLAIENVLSFSVKTHELRNSNISNLKEKIKNKFKEYKEKNNGLFRLTSQELPEYAVSSNFSSFFDEMSFLEKTLNYIKNQNKVCLPQDTSFEASEHFTFGQESVYQYCIAFDFVKENPLSRMFLFIPSFVLLFPTVDADYKSVCPEIIFEQMKKELSFEYNKLIDDKPLQMPQLICNPKIFEPYNLDTNPSITGETIQDKLSSIREYLSESSILKEYVKSNSSLNNQNNKNPLFKGVFLCAISQNMTQGLVKIYDAMLSTGKANLNSTIKKYFFIHKRKIDSADARSIEPEDIFSSQKEVESVLDHYGAFDKKYCLAETQRKALLCSLNKSSLIIPVNGAPGTGKTSLLRAVFGDYIVKAAIDSYKTYKEKRKVYFKTPIVCSSTNNQALFNISEGIESGFTSTIKNHKDNIFYERWIKHVHSKNNIEEADLEEKSEEEVETTEVNKDRSVVDFSKTLFVPSVKTSSKYARENPFILSRSDMFSICGEVASKKEYVKYFISCFETLFGPTPGETLLEKLNFVADSLFARLTENIKIIRQNYINFEALNKLDELENKIIKKYIESGSNEFDIKQDFLYIRKNIDTIKEAFLQLDILPIEKEKLKKNLEMEKENQKLIENEITVLQKKITDCINEIAQEEQKQQELEKYKEQPQKYPFYNQIFEEKKIDVINQYKKIIAEETRQEINEALKNLCFLSRWMYKVFNIGSIKKTITQIKMEKQQLMDSCKERFEVKEKTSLLTKKYIFEKIQNDIQELAVLIAAKKEFLTKKQAELTKIKKLLDDVIAKINKITFKSNEIDTALENAKKKIPKTINNRKDVEAFLSHKTTYAMIEKFFKEKAALDTKERTDNFYYALHLLEALFFVSNVSIWGDDNIKEFETTGVPCPACKEGVLSWNEKGYKCLLCGSFYSINNPNNPSDLTRNQIVFILQNEKARIGNKFYVVEINNTYININESNEAFTRFNQILPIFPMICITCNSFGLVAADREEESNAIYKDLFDYVLIDEAGTITPSKMSILYCGKKAMFFGDTKQLKPVFSYKAQIEEGILRKFFSDERVIKLISEYFSCADKDSSDNNNKTSNDKKIKKVNNAMDVANNCVTFFLPYEPSLIEGDIWLKEHYRCRDAIVNIANEIAYKGEILPQREKIEGIKHWKHLDFVHHEGQRNKNNTNEVEADLIIDYIKNNKERLKAILSEITKKQFSDQDYYLSIGIITPFVNQEALLKDKLKDNHMEAVKVGTVHKFQGSERQIILFSTVYNVGGSTKTENFFFNREDPDMINVAVTRAKELFVCFGNKNLLNKEGTYSGIMMKHIFEHKKSHPVNRDGLKLWKDWELYQIFTKTY